MPRETVTASRQRAGSNPQVTSAPGLEVTAQIVAPRNNAPDNWASLKNVLLLGGQIAGVAKQQEEANAAAWKAQGVADRQTDHVDDALEQKHRAYADGVTHAAAVTQTQAALQDALQEIEETVDKTLPLDEQMLKVDGIIQSHTGPIVASDPIARRAAAPLIRDYYSQIAGTRGQSLVGQHQAEAADALSAQIGAAVDGGPISLPDAIAQAAGVFPGGRTQAWEVGVDRLAQIAEERNDLTVLELLPKTYVNDDGVTVASPINSVKAQARLNLAKDRIAQYQAKIAKPQKEWEFTQALAPFEDRIDKGLPIAFAELKPFVTSGQMSAEGAWGLVNRSETARKALHEKALKWDTEKSLLSSFGVQSFHDIIGVTDGPKTASEADEWNGRRMTEVMSATIGQGTELSGPQIMQSPQAMAQALALSKATRTAFPALKGALNNIDLSDGNTVIKRLDAYRAVKAQGQTASYLPDDTQAAVYEAALGQKDMGVKDEDIARNIARYNDPTFRASQVEARSQIDKKVASASFDTQGKWFDQGLDSMAGPSRLYAQSKIKQIANVFVGMGDSPDAAVQKATDRFKATNQAIRINGQNILVPTTSGDPQTLKATIEWAAPKAEELAKAAGVNPKGATLRFMPPANGQDATVMTVDAHGVPFGPVLSLSKLTEAYRKAHGDNYDEVVKKSRQGQAYRQRMNEIYSPDNPFATKMLQ
ncbi:hypothetical protein [Stenotrophomonas muris]|uniref:hypothetical protein n=1 Tax=Stenotrophomonas muris TaxID=2963283 RepID=UPI00405560F0